MTRSTTGRRGALRLTAVLSLAGALAACSGGTVASQKVSAPPLTTSSLTPVASMPAGSPSAGGSASPGPAASPGGSPAAGASVGSLATDTPAPSDAGPSSSAEADASGGTVTGGDIPDNAVFLDYNDPTHPFSIQYVEGWQVSTNNDGVAIRDKDSSEIVQVMPPIADVKAYITGTDLAALQQTEAFKLLTQDVVKIRGHQIDHLQYEQLSPPDPVTNKRIPSLVDRYYYPGTNGLAVLTMSTPKSVDNVDAFKQMADSFTWK